MFQNNPSHQTRGCSAGSRRGLRGFTLVEVILYISLVSVVGTALSVFAVQFFQIRSRSANETDVLQQARFVMDRVLRNVRLAPGIDTGGSTFNADTGVLVLKGQSAASPRITYRIEGGIITEAIGSAPSVPLHTAAFRATVLRFHQAVASPIQSGIEITITLDGTPIAGLVRGAKSTLTAQASLRSHFPYHALQNDWSGGSGQATWADQTRYEADSGTVNPQACQGNLMLSNNPLEVVIWASDACSINGNFRKVADATAAGGYRVEDMPDQNQRVGGHFGNAADSNPVNYLDTAFAASAGTVYHFWGRFKVINTAGSDTSDSIYIQFSDSLSTSAYPPAGRPINRIGASQALVPACSNGANWCWEDIWTGITNEGEIMSFAAGGIHGLRVQRREDGYALDQVVISSNTYKNSAPPNAIIAKRYAASGTLTSSAFDTSAGSVFGNARWSAFTPPGTRVRLQLRTAATQAGLAAASWRGAGGAVNGTYDESGEGVSVLHDGDRWLQYRALLDTTDSTVTPVLNSVEITYIQ